MKAWSALAWLAIQQQQQQQQHKSSLFIARAFASSSRTTSTRLVNTARGNFGISSSFPYHRSTLSSTTSRNMSTAAADTSEMDDIDVAENLRIVRESIQAAKSPHPEKPVRLVAVSKTKPIELLLKAYDEGGCRIFGENYARELVEKVPLMANDVQWHFIGNLQSNKANMLVNAFDDVSRLVVETIDKIKLANKLNNAVAGKEGKLKVFVQVNTSGEESKSGCEPSEVLELCEQIIKECENLQLMGLMTIGAPGDLSCFDTLAACRDTVQEKIGMELELSMGMSGDFVQAIEKGSTNVRVGSTIFGARNYANKV
uniref:Pyridoxal phosphate homeostasis protein n=1 Tax=Amphora coffeiformis TaxID=265554 RepID=A0A7S3P5G3_9STRA|mmetsp:Transcript_132/g.223  ORF Transcript_132/g.223 Transcript_132/m.223 type:complete len:314 (+) Transcript_132:115-1056(+)